MQIHTTKLEDPQLEETSSRSNDDLSARSQSECEGQRHRECIAGRVASAISELRNLQDLLLSDDVDPRLLTDFRDALNRTRNTAWAVQQYLACLTTEADPASLMNILAAERIRVAYQLGHAVVADLQKPDLKLQPGQLLELYKVTKELSARLAELVD
jgi:hypothetical protein